MVLILLALVLGSWMVNIPIKLFFFRERPYEILEGVRTLGHLWSNSSFPSGHIASSMAALVMLAYLFKDQLKWIVFLSFFVLFLGFARIYAGMHYPLDVLGGIIVGSFSAATIIWLDKQIKFSKKT